MKGANFSSSSSDEVKASTLLRASSSMIDLSSKESSKLASSFSPYSSSMTWIDVCKVFVGILGPPKGAYYYYCDYYY